jgi:hypothetical protein
MTLSKDVGPRDKEREREEGIDIAERLVNKVVEWCMMAKYTKFKSTNKDKERERENFLLFSSKL